MAKEVEVVKKSGESGDAGNAEEPSAELEFRLIDF
jgi:hypothetical protein